MEVYVSGNNGVFAVVVDTNPTQIFTFVDDDRFADDPGWVTGNLTLMNELIRGHTIKIGSGYVPFSKGFEYNADPAISGPEQAYRTTEEQARAAFAQMPVHA